MPRDEPFLAFLSNLLSLPGATPASIRRGVDGYLSFAGDDVSLGERDDALAIYELLRDGEVGVVRQFVAARIGSTARKSEASCVAGTVGPREPSGEHQIDRRPGGHVEGPAHLVLEIKSDDCLQFLKLHTTGEYAPASSPQIMDFVYELHRNPAGLRLRDSLCIKKAGRTTRDDMLLIHARDDFGHEYFEVLGHKRAGIDRVVRFLIPRDRRFEFRPVPLLTPQHLLLRLSEVKQSAAKRVR